MFPGEDPFTPPTGTESEPLPEPGIVAENNTENANNNNWNEEDADAKGGMELVFDAEYDGRVKVGKRQNQPLGGDAGVAMLEDTWKVRASKKTKRVGGSYGLFGGGSVGGGGSTFGYWR